MNEEMTPQDALAAATTAQASARTMTAMPRWFPAAVSITWTLGVTLVGIWQLNPRWRLAGIAGAVFVAGFAALWVMLVTRWRRRGLVQVAPRLDRSLPQRRRRIGSAADSVAIVLSLAAFAATGSLGWMAIIAGPLLGGTTWYRLGMHTA